MCLDLQNDSNNCGQCGRGCSGAQVCLAGVCATLPTDCTQPGARCGAGYSCDPVTHMCRTGCRLNADCPSGATCNPASGQCSCPAMQHACGQTCVSDTSIASCGNNCSACAPPPMPNGVSTICVQGACSFTCTPGFTRQGTACVDLDECATGNGGCGAHATCTNTVGSRTCACNAGFTGDGFTCADINECATNNGGCSTLATCTNTPGARTCTCTAGFTGDGVTCSDLNECSTNNGGCSTNAACTNLPGTFSCACLQGYSGDGGSCVDVNECSTNNGGCSTNATCTNLPGAFSCACVAGYAGDGGTCTDVDECLVSNGGCTAHANCFNAPGTRHCQCGVGYAASGTTCTPVWTPMHSIGRGSLTMVFDSLRSRFVAFGGGDPDRPFGETLESTDGTSWTVVATAGPAPRTRHAMTFDAARGVVVLFGGETPSGLLNDTWEWNGSVWFSRSPATAPPARAEHAIAWDAVRQETVLFGGSGAAGLLADTWVWNGTTWSQRSGSAPPQRCRHTLTWHGTRQAVSLVAGIGSTGTFDDHWEWNGTSWTSLAAPGLNGRSLHFAAWDPTGRRLIVGGGRGATDAWAWSGSAWSALPSPGQPLAAAALACSSSRCVLHGGIEGTSTFATATPLTRRLEASGWTTLFTSPTLEDATATFDSARGRIIATGTSGLFEWTGSSWEQELTSVPAELARYDEWRGVTVIYAGSGAGTAARTTRWNGFTATVTNTDPTPGRLGQTGAYNPATHAVMLFGGVRPPTSADPVYRWYSDLWQWTGTAWSSVGNIGVSPGRGEAALAYDPVRNQLLVFGGTNPAGGFLGDTWTWSGTLSPARLVTGASPPARAQAAITWDPDAQRIVLYGGRASLGVAYADLWSWDGSTWSAITSDRTAGRAGQLEYDVANHRLIHFNGSGELWYRPRN